MLWQCQDAGCGKILERYELLTVRYPRTVHKPLVFNDVEKVPGYTSPARTVRRCQFCRGRPRLIPQAELHLTRAALAAQLLRAERKAARGPEVFRESYRIEAEGLRHKIHLIDNPNPRFYALACKRV